jgi:hypothetical protein
VNYWPLKRIVDHANDRGLKVIVSVAQSPEWLDADGGIPDNLEPFGDFMEVLAREFQGQVHGWEIWNEQNLAYEVGGYSSDGWYSGTAEFFDDGDGWGLISLSESIEDAWTWDENAKAVVVHEVGHVQVLRDACSAIFTAGEFDGDHEAWATAWAIGMGYDMPGAGIEAYGRPSAAQIAAAAGCR